MALRVLPGLVTSPAATSICPAPGPNPSLLILLLILAPPITLSHIPASMPSVERNAPEGSGVKAEAVMWSCRVHGGDMNIASWTSWRGSLTSSGGVLGLGLLPLGGMYMCLVLGHTRKNFYLAPFFSLLCPLCSFFLILLLAQEWNSPRKESSFLFLEALAHLRPGEFAEKQSPSRN